MAQYSLKLKEEVIEIEQAEGVSAKYTLRELRGRERDAFLNHMAARVKMVKGVPTGMRDISGIQSHLLSKCLYDPENKLVPKQEIEDWPADMQTDLFLRAQKLSAIGRTEVENDGFEEEAKKD